MASGSCYKCGQPTVLYCEHADADGQVVGRPYCSKECQIADRPAHKVDCIAGRRRLHIYRAGRLLRDIFLIAREQVFDMSVEKVTKDVNGLIHVFEFRLAKEVVPPFAKMSTDDFDERDKKALLSYMGCSDAVCLLPTLAKKAFTGLCQSLSSDIEELGVMMKRPQQRIVKHNTSPQEYSEPSVTDVEEIDGEEIDGEEIDGEEVNDHGHVLMRLKLKDGTCYALDPAGAQYGQYRAVLLYEEYLHRYVDVSKDPEATKSGKIYEDTWEDLKGQTSSSGLEEYNFHWIWVHVKEELERLIAEWEGRKGKSLAELFKLGEKLYSRDRHELLTTVSRGIAAYVRRSRDDGTFVFCV